MKLHWYILNSGVKTCFGDVLDVLIYGRRQGWISLPVRVCVPARWWACACICSWRDSHVVMCGWVGEAEGRRRGRGGVVVDVSFLYFCPCLCISEVVGMCLYM